MGNCSCVRPESHSRVQKLESKNENAECYHYTQGPSSQMRIKVKNAHQEKAVESTNDN